MKTKRFFPAVMISAALVSLTLVSGCKKEDRTKPDDFLSEGQEMGQTEDVSTDIDNSIAEAFDLHGNGSISERHGEDANSELGNCATVTWDLVSTTITIHFDHCVGPHGHYRDGDVIVKYSAGGGYWIPGSSWDVTFNNFYVDDKQVTGTRHVDNAGPASNGMTWNIQANLKFTKTSGGTYRDWNSTRTRVLVQGYNDVPANRIYKINGTATSFHSKNGVTCSLTFTDLIRSLSCNWITAGTIDITRTNKPTLKIDFGTGTCDDDAIVYKDGTPHDIHLKGPHK